MAILERKLALTVSFAFRADMTASGVSNPQDVCVLPIPLLKLSGSLLQLTNLYRALTESRYFAHNVLQNRDYFYSSAAWLTSSCVGPTAATNTK